MLNLWNFTGSAVHSVRVPRDSRLVRFASAFFELRCCCTCILNQKLKKVPRAIENSRRDTTGRLRHRLGFSPVSGTIPSSWGVEEVQSQSAELTRERQARSEEWTKTKHEPRLPKNKRSSPSKKREIAFNFYIQPIRNHEFAIVRCAPPSATRSIEHRFIYFEPNQFPRSAVRLGEYLVRCVLLLCGLCLWTSSASLGSVRSPSVL